MTDQSTDIVTQAYNDFMTKLFGTVPANASEYTVSEEVYRGCMQQVMAKHGLHQGHPKYLEFILTMVGRSPQIDRGAEEGNG